MLHYILYCTCCTLSVSTCSQTKLSKRLADKYCETCFKITHVYYIMVMRVLQSIMCCHEVFHVWLVHDLHGVFVVALHYHTCRKKKSPKNVKQARRYLARRVLSPLLGHKL